MTREAVGNLQGESSAADVLPIGEGSGINRKKYAAALKNANELLHFSSERVYSLQDFSDTDKLGRLLRYLKTGSICVVLCHGYVESMI